MRARMLGVRGRVVQNGIGEAHVFLLTCAPCAEPNGSVYCKHKKLLGNKQWGAVDKIKHCEKRLPLQVVSHSNSKRLQSGAFYYASESTQSLCYKGVLFSFNFDDHWSPHFHRFVILRMLGYTK